MKESTMSNDSGFGKGLVWLTIGALIGGLVVATVSRSMNPLPTSPSTGAANSPTNTVPVPPTSEKTTTTDSAAANSTAPAPSPSPTPIKTVEASGNAPTVFVNGEAITLRQMEDALLSQEGVQQLLEMLEKHYNGTDWTKLSDRDVVVQTGTWRLTRVSLAAQLLKMKAGDAREDLIGIALVQQAMAKAGVNVDEAVIQNEVKRMEKRHYDALEARKQPYMEFRSFIEQTQKMKFDEYIHQDGFKVGAGIRILVENAAKKELTDDQLKAFMVEHINRYRVQEAADVSAIYTPYTKAKGPDGKEMVSAAEKSRLLGVMQNLHKAILGRQVSFERTFQAFGKVYEQHADANGRLGFVNRDGTRPIKGSRRIDAHAMEEALAAQPPYPVLLAPIASDEGVEILLVHSRRSGKEPEFDQLRERLISDIVDAELAERTKRTLADIRRTSVIDYQSLPPLIDQRVKDAGLPNLDPPVSAESNP
jgi:hypothetical protein